MKKRIFCLLLALGMLLCLCACGDARAAPTSEPGTEPTSEPTSAPTPEVTPPPPPLTPELTPEPTPIPEVTPEPTPIPEPEKPAFQEYLVVLGAEIHAYDGPSYDRGYTGFIVGESGTYTIVEERWDDEGNLWGRLKSGAGWVDLTEARAERPAFKEYLVALGAVTPIYSGPSYDETYAGVVGENGTYTIVEERWDGEGNLWGKLKSGAGWINLTAVQTEKTQAVPLRVCYAEDLKLGGAYDEFIASEGEFAVKLAFVAGVNLRGIVFRAMSSGEALFEPGETLYEKEKMDAGEVLVVAVEFPGDFSSYGFSCTDEAGETYHYAVYISGRNGEPALQTYTI